MPPPLPFGSHVPVLLLTKPRAWRLSEQVIAALSLTLLPLGILAFIAAIDAYREVGITRERLARTRLEAAAQMVGERMGQDVAALRDVLIGGARSDGCAAALNSTRNDRSRLGAIVRVDAGGGTLCRAGTGPEPSTGLWRDLRRAPLGAAGAWQTRAVADKADLLLVVRDNGPLGRGDAVVGRITAASIGTLVDPRLLGPGDGLTLELGRRAIHRWGAAAQTGSSTKQAGVVGATGLSLTLTSAVAPITPARAIGIALPAFMWLSALAIAWVAIDRIAVRPIGRMRASVERYAAGGRDERIAALGPRSRELDELAMAFDAMADRVRRHEVDMEALLATQRALTREVHHRVKNNLQIVSSLLSIQARGVDNPEVADAYALIRLRVTALSLVHRWMYQDEAANGVDLRGLIGDLTANLEHGFDGRAEGGGRVIAHVARLTVSQDTALPIAFLVTELVSGVARLSLAPDTVVRVDAVASSAGRATLTIAAAPFATSEGIERFDEGARRIIAGLARQLRGALRHDPENGRYAIDFPVLGGG